MSTRQVRTFRISAMTTADVAKKWSPGNVRTYLMLRMSDAFWTTSTARLMYFNLLFAGIKSRNQGIGVDIKPKSMDSDAGASRWASLEPSDPSYEDKTEQESQ